MKGIDWQLKVNKQVVDSNVTLNLTTILDAKEISSNAKLEIANAIANNLLHIAHVETEVAELELV